MFRALFTVRVHHVVALAAVALFNASAWALNGRLSWWTIAPAFAIAAVQVAAWAVFQAHMTRRYRDLARTVRAEEERLDLMVRTALRMVEAHAGIRDDDDDDPR